MQVLPCILQIKGALCCCGDKILIERERSSLTYLVFDALTSCLNKLNKQTDLKVRHNFVLFYFVYLWQTLPPFQLQTVIVLLLH